MQQSRPRRWWSAVCAALVVVLAACDAFGPADAGVPLEDVLTTGRPLPGSLAETPTGPHVELLTAQVAGQEMEIAMQRDGPGVCMAVRRPPASSESCGPAPGNEPGLRVFGMTLVDSPPEADPAAPTAVAGLVTAAVDSVAIELEDGTEAAARLFSLAPARVEGTGFIVYVPSGARQSALVARDVDGEELERLEFIGP
jgi:hypothetical protein